jgi:serine/threonine protein kinase
MVFVPERREAALFAFIFVLAVSAALPFWQQGKFRNTSPALPSVQQAATPAAPAVTLPVDAATATTAGTQVPDRTDVHQPPFDQKSFFPRELENRYYDITYIGRGGIAWVYCAKRKSDGMKVAVKIPISFDEMTGKSFLNEIKAWEMLRHPNIVEISAVNILPVPFVEMEYVPGSLEATAKPVPVWKAVHIVRSIADALHYAHGLGLIHRDIKPHNILVTDDLSPKISDWGMSKLLAADPKKSSIAGFSLSYAAPEQVSPAEFGRTDARTDIYQLGVLFYELVTGSIPFCGESIVEVGNAILRVPPVPPSKHIPEAAAVDRIILRCLEKDPQKRYQSAAELLDALAGYLDEDEP